MARKDLQEDRIRRIIEITAEHFERKLSEADLLKILEKCRKPGRPPRRRWTNEQLFTLEKVRLELTAKRAARPTTAARIVAEAAPFTGKTTTATYHWLRRYFAEYQREARDEEFRRAVLRSFGAGKKPKS